MMQNQADATGTGAVPFTLPSFPKFDLDEFTTVEQDGKMWKSFRGFMCCFKYNWELSKNWT